MTSSQIMFHVADVLEQLNINYMLVGSFSSNLYGIPRSTQDADFVVEMGTVDPATIGKLLDSELRLDPQMQFETITGTSRFIVTHTTSAFKVELFLFSDDPFHRERFRRRIRADVLGRLTWVPTAEDVIVQKLRWYARAKRSKDYDDIRDVLNVQKGLLDLTYIRSWCDQHGSREYLEGLLNEENLPEA